MSWDKTSISVRFPKFQDIEWVCDTLQGYPSQMRQCFDMLQVWASVQRTRNSERSSASLHQPVLEHFSTQNLFIGGPTKLLVLVQTLRPTDSLSSILF